MKWIRHYVLVLYFILFNKLGATDRISEDANVLSYSDTEATYLSKQLNLKLLFNDAKMLPVHLCVCVCVCVYVCSPPLSRGSTQQSLSAKSAECEGWCQMTNLRDKLHLKQTFFIVRPSPLQYSPSNHLSILFSPLHLSNPLISL